MPDGYNKNKWIDILLWVLIVVLIVVLCLRVFVLVSIEVDGVSMYPTLEDGMTLWGSKLTTAQRGDIVVFDYGDDILIKRVVAIAGDSVWAESSDSVYTLYVLTADGDTLSEQYSYNGLEVQLTTMYSVGFLSQYTSATDSYTVAEGFFLPMGDNREFSYDGRDFGVVSTAAIIAVII